MIFKQVTIAAFLAGSALAFPFGPALSAGWGLAESIRQGQRPATALTEIALSQKELESAKGFVDEVAQRGINFLKDNTLDTQAKRNEFKKLLADSFDMKTIGRFTLGRYWRTATEEQRTEFLKLFENMVVESYTQRFNEYKGQDLRVTGAEPTGESDILVNSIIVPPEGPEFRVDWRLRPQDGGRYKIVDVIAEGVSMALTQRSEFASVIQRGGGNIQTLIDHLRR